jgi:hypothetical protein
MYGSMLRAVLRGRYATESPCSSVRFSSLLRGRVSRKQEKAAEVNAAPFNAFTLHVHMIEACDGR